LDKCPLCEKPCANVLVHLNTRHEIFTAEQLRVEIEKRSSQKRKREEFGIFVDELKSKLAREQITAEQYRAFTENWWKEKKQEEKV
jgi:hypothetical protein